MACWERPVLSLALCAGAVAASASPSRADVPLLDVGAGVSAGYHVVPGGAFDLTGAVNLRGLVVGAQYWRGLGLGAAALPDLARLNVGYNVSPVPMIRLAPSVGGAYLAGSFAPELALTADFHPFLLPVGLEAQVAAQYYPGFGGVLLPYHAGVSISPFPFTSLWLRYRGWAGNGAAPLVGVGGPELALAIGI